MAKTLFFIEALAFALVALAFPVIAADAAAAFILPVAVSLLIPLACAAAAWPPASVLFALRAAFAAEAPAPEAAREGARVLESMTGFSRLASALGFLLAVVAACRGAPFGGGAGTLTLLGAFLAAYALVNAQLWRVLGAVVRRLAEAASIAEGSEARGEAEARAAFAAAHGLTRREWETAERIAGGLSYKETAYELGISIRTVKAHMSRVYEKTGAASNVALALLLKGSGPPATKVR